MSNQEIQQATVETQASIRSGLGVMRLALFNPNGTPFSGVAPAAGAHVAPVTVANATDLASAQTLANANKVAINALITSLQAAGFLAAT